MLRPVCTVEEIPFLAMPIHVVTELSIEPHGTSRTLQRLADSSHVNKLSLHPAFECNFPSLFRRPRLLSHTGLRCCEADARRS